MKASQLRSGRRGSYMIVRAADKTIVIGLAADSGEPPDASRKGARAPPAVALPAHHADPLTGPSYPLADRRLRQVYLHASPDVAVRR